MLHSLGIAKVIRFKPGTKVMDLGTGGGFPGIRWRYSFPKCSFTVDSIGKKVRVATEIAGSIGLKNVTTRHARAEEEKQLFDFVVSRAVMPLTDFAENNPQEHLAQTAERTAQRTHLPQRRRAGERDDAREEQNHDVEPQGIFRGRVLRDQKGGVRAN